MDDLDCLGDWGVYQVGNLNCYEKGLFPVAPASLPTRETFIKVGKKENKLFDGTLGKESCIFHVRTRIFKRFGGFLECFGEMPVDNDSSSRPADGLATEEGDVGENSPRRRGKAICRPVGALLTYSTPKY